MERSPFAQGRFGDIFFFPGEVAQHATIHHGRSGKMCSGDYVDQRRHRMQLSGSPNDARSEDSPTLQYNYRLCSLIGLLL